MKYRVQIYIKKNEKVLKLDFFFFFCDCGYWT